MDIRRVSKAFDAVRSGRVKTIPLTQIYPILMKAYVTEFFTQDEENIIQKVEVADGVRSATSGGYSQMH